MLLWKILLLSAGNDLLTAYDPGMLNTLEDLIKWSLLHLIARLRPVYQ